MEDSEVHKLSALTGLRFIAAFMIVIYHSQRFGLKISDFYYNHGVTFFFVLSGFVLAYVHPSLDGRRETALFIWDRIARIWPAHLAMLIVMVVFLGSPVTWILPLNLFLLQGWIPLEKFYFSYNSVSWSVSSELALYLIFPFLIYRWRKTYWWKLLLAAAIVLVTVKLCDIFQLGDRQPESITGHGLIYINPLGRILEFVTGMACCSVFRWLWGRGPNSFALFTGVEVLSVCGLYLRV